MITREELLALMRQERYAVLASVNESGDPQAAVVGVIVTSDFALFLDTLESSRKGQNLRRHPRLAFTLGPMDASAGWTIQFEGLAEEPTGAERDRLWADYLKLFPDGTARESWPGIMYVRVRPLWIRYSDFRVLPPVIQEFGPPDLG